jgi:hypothetical protein
LADVYRLNGDAATALETVDEAIEVAIARRARAPECLARIVRAEILLGSKSTDQKAAWDELARAKELVHETGAFIYSPIIDALAVEGNRSLQAGSAISTG